MAAAEVLGTLTSQKEPFSHSDMSTIYSKSQWKFKITIELTFMDNIKTWKNTAKRMIDFLPVTWKCCFYSAHFQPGGKFLYLTLSWNLGVVFSNTGTGQPWTELSSKHQSNLCFLSHVPTHLPSAQANGLVVSAKVCAKPAKILGIFPCWNGSAAGIGYTPPKKSSWG